MSIDLQDLFTVANIKGNVNSSKHQASKKNHKHIVNSSRRPSVGKISPAQFRKGNKMAKNMGIKLPARISDVKNVVEVDLNSL